jgi:hypothetical protein
MAHKMKSTKMNFFNLNLAMALHLKTRPLETLNIFEKWENQKTHEASHVIIKAQEIFVKKMAVR